MDEVLAAARQVDWTKLAGRSLCDACLGRLFGKLGHGHTNAERGASVRSNLPATNGACWICAGLTSRYDDLAALVVRKLEPWSFETFLVGSKVDPEIQAREESLWRELAVTSAEAIKTEINREVGKRVSERIGREADFENPDIVAIVDTPFDYVGLQVNPLYLRGRYRKLARGLPQTRWPCRACMGKGCARCGGTGKMYPSSVEEIVATAVMVESGGTGHALHGMGREDVDARMLGRGRPFIIEIREPRIRRIDLHAAVGRANTSGTVEVDALVPAHKKDVVALKADRADKTYRVLVRFIPPVDEAKLKWELGLFGNQPIAQRTPSRVAHRRADTTRHRTVKRLDLLRLDGDIAEIRATAEAGVYIKELVHGDLGRTQPSLAERLGVGCEVLELDVEEVHSDG